MIKTPDNSDSKKIDDAADREPLRVALEERTGPLTLTPPRSVDDILRRIGDTPNKDEPITR